METEKKVDFLRFVYDSASPNSTAVKGDVVFVLRGWTQESLYAHKFVLAGRSAVFAQMFANAGNDDGEEIMELVGVPYEAMRATINFCYNAEITFTDITTPEEVFETACKYDIELLKEICENELRTTISKANLLERLKLSKRLDATELKKTAIAFLKNNFEDVISSVVSDL